MIFDWAYYPNFSQEEFKCRQTGECVMHPEFMQRLQLLRSRFGKPMPISSGYRSPDHSIERVKASPGEHTTGRAADIRVHGPDAIKLIALAFEMGFTRIGVQQKGEYKARFIHLGDNPAFPPGVWSY